MRGSTTRGFLVGGVAAAAFALSAAATGHADPSGPQAFYFRAECTGLGSVILSNAGPSHAAALQVVGSSTVVLVPANRALEERAITAGTTCTFNAFGTDPSDLTPNPEPEDIPVVLVRQ